MFFSHALEILKLKNLLDPFYHSAWKTLFYIRNVIRRFVNFFITFGKMFRLGRNTENSTTTSHDILSQPLCFNPNIPVTNKPVVLFCLFVIFVCGFFYRTWCKKISILLMIC